MGQRFVFGQDQWRAKVFRESRDCAANSFGSFGLLELGIWTGGFGREMIFQCRFGLSAFGVHRDLWVP